MKIEFIMNLLHRYSTSEPNENVDMRLNVWSNGMIIENENQIKKKMHYEAMMMMIYVEKLTHLAKYWSRHDYDND